MPGEYGFGDVAYERTSFAVREEGKEWVGTAAALWGITAGVYLALMGPQGMRELGETMMARTRYAMARLAAIPGVRVPFAATPPRQGVRAWTSAATGPDGGRRRRRAPRPSGIFLGDGPLARAARAWARRRSSRVTEVHTQADIDRLAAELAEVLR